MELKRELTERQRALLWLSAAEVTSERVRQLTEEFGSPEEVYQAENYVRQIKKSGALHKAASIHAFVVGCHIGDIDTHKSSESGIVDVVTYGQLVETANMKLFGLRETLEEHYKTLDEESLVEKALKQPVQMKIKFPND